MFHQVISDLKNSTASGGREKKKRKKPSSSLSGGGGGECSHESNVSMSNLSYRPFAETPDIFKALPTSNFYYSYQGEDESLKSIGVLQFSMQPDASDGDTINPMLASRIHSCLQSDPCSSAAADVTSGHFSRLSTLSVCPENIVDLSSSPSLFPAIMSFHPDAGSQQQHHYDDAAVAAASLPLDSLPLGPEYSGLDLRLQLTCQDEEEMWDQFQGSVASSLHQKYLTRTSEECQTERRAGRKNRDKKKKRKRLSLLISRMIPSRRVFGTSHYCQPLSSCEYDHPDPAIAVVTHKQDCTSSQKRSPWSTSCSCSPLVLTVFVVLLLLFASLTFGKILRIDNLWKSDLSDDGSAHFEDLRENWWQDGIFYEIFPASFRDSDSDGFGDLNGIREKVSYIKELGVTGIRLNSFFTAMDYPYQYDHVTDFKSVDPHIGSLSDFKALIRLVHQHRLTLIIDINPCITSDQHHWATQWLSNKSSSYSSFYVINAENERPLDLTSTTASDRKSEDLQEIHLSFGGHLFLNWSSPAVRERMLDAFRFWLRLGVDGFYLRNVHNMQFQSPEDVFEVLNELHEVMRDEEERFRRKGQKWTGDPKARSHDQGTRKEREQEQEQQNKRRQRLPQKRILIASRSSLMTLASKLGRDRNRFSPLKSNFRKRLFQVSHARIVVADRGGNKADTAGPEPSSDKPADGVSLAVDPDIFSYFHLIDTFLDIRRNETENIRAQVNEVFLNEHKSGILWNIGSATSSRLVSRVGSEYSAVAAFLLIMMPGSISFFYGDEIGLKDSRDSLSNREYRGGQLTPMLWDSEKNGNFSRSSESIPWIPVNNNYLTNNVQLQSEVILRLQQLTSFRRNNFVPDSGTKAGNYLFHYVHDGEIVLERYFTRVNELDILNAMQLILVNGDVRSRRSPSAGAACHHCLEDQSEEMRMRQRREEAVVRCRFVLFANLATTARVRDLRDKFHLGSIKVTSIPKRMRDFLYFRSLKLDPGEAIIAQVE